ncbi:MAG: leucine--tRNA ligase [Microgenomates group bacterium]
MTKTYVLGMFPYPSGEGLHVGHVRIFTACDVMARYFRMKAEGDNKVSYPLGSSRALGFPTSHESVMSPMGWDAFGLPAENAAIKAKKIPQEMVPHNYANFKKQMQNLSLSFDWEREFATTDPSYYAITQWIFLQLYKKGLVYREKVAINWCPKCLTGLANEEVLPDGTHERCGTVVGKKLLPQWVMKITAYAERLLNDLDKEKLDWPKGILEMQRNWIGKKEGMRLFHQVEGMDLQLDAFSAYPIWCFADTFMVIAPEHPLVKKLVEGTKYEIEVTDFVTESGKITAEQRTADKFEKKGVFTGRYTNDPFNPGKKLPVWVANFAMMGFGTGIIRCSSHDPRDYEFAQKYNIPLKEVVERTEPNLPVNAHTNEGVLKDSGVFSGKSITKESIEEVKDWIEKEGIGERETTYHLRDWVFSRQRYWGEPIPLVYCEKCGDANGVVVLPERQLPLTLPTLESYEPTDTGESPLSRVTDWVNTKCPKCGGPAKRETDTMPNWAGSCWYFLAFAFWKDGFKVPNSGPESSEPYTKWWHEEALPKIKEWLPVDWYLGGAEHAVLHLLYARFWVKVLQDLGLLDFPEPFLRLRSVGLVLAEDGKKMSKSIGNVVNPDDMVAKYGSDAVRMYEMFMGPWEQSIAWDSGAISGQVRFLGRIKDTIKQKGKIGEQTSPVLAAKLKELVARVEDGVLNQKFNTSIAGLMEFINTWREPDMVLSPEHVGMFASLLSLFAPIIAGEIFKSQSSEHSLTQGSELGLQWPDVSQIQGVESVMVTIAVQVNGKLRGTIEVSSSEANNQDLVVKQVMANEQIKKWITGETKKTIFVPGKLVNLVV